MALDPSNVTDKIDPELKEFIVNEQIKTQIRAQIRKLNNICFDKCIEKPDSPDGHQQTFHLIRLPKEACQKPGGHVGNLTMDPADGTIVFQDSDSRKLYTLVSNKVEPAKGATNPSSHDLLRLSIDQDEAVHLGRVAVNTIMCVPRDNP